MRNDPVPPGGTSNPKTGHWAYVPWLSCYLDERSLMRKQKRGFPPIYFLFLAIAVAVMVCVTVFVLPDTMVRGAKMLILFGGVIVLFFGSVLIHSLIRKKGNWAGRRR